MSSPQTGDEATKCRRTPDSIKFHLPNGEDSDILVNSAAPERYGSAEDNLVRDPASGKVSGLKFLQLRF